jgi:hypothetical protein
VPSGTEGEETIPAQTAVHSPTGNTTEEADDDNLFSFTDEEESGTAAPSDDHDGEQATDGKEAPDQAPTLPNPHGAQNPGGDQPIEKEKIANAAHLARNVLGTDKDLAKPATEWGCAQLASAMRDAQAAFDGLADCGDEDAIKAFFKSDNCNCNSVATLSTGVKRCNWHQESHASREGHFALNTVIPLPNGVAEKFVLISVPELESLRCKVELHENVEKCCKGIKKPLARSLDVPVDNPESAEAKMCSALLDQTRLARSLEALAELAVNPTRETKKGLLSTHQNLLTVHHDFPTLAALCVAAPSAADRERSIILTELDEVLLLLKNLASAEFEDERFAVLDSIREILKNRAKAHLGVSDSAHSARLTAARVGCRALDLQADNQALRKKVRDMASTILDFANSSAEDYNATHQLAEELCVMRNSNAQLSKFHFKQMVNHHENV